MESAIDEVQDEKQMTDFFADRADLRQICQFCVCNKSVHTLIICFRSDFESTKSFYEM